MRIEDKSSNMASAKPKVALITGVGGQDGGYLSELLLRKGYTVYGISRRASMFDADRTECLHQAKHEEPRRFVLYHGDMTNSVGLRRIVEQTQPDEIYNLAAQSEVAYSFEEPEYTADSDALGPLRILEAVRKSGLAKRTRFYQASSSELFGKAQETPQNENTPFYPRSPYAVAKMYAYWITVNYREAYGMYACNGILFNHESPLRRTSFVSRKITHALTRIALGLQTCVHLGNLSARRDWGHARDYVEMQWLMLQQETPEDFVIATGKQHSVRDFVNTAAAALGMALEWQGKGEEEIGIVLDRGPHTGIERGQVIVRVDPRYFRPCEVETSLGDPSKAHAKLGWTPATTFEQLVKEMVRADLSAGINNIEIKRPDDFVYASND